MTNVLTQYEAAIHRGEIDDDMLQREILARMQYLADEVKKSNSSWFYPLRVCIFMVLLGWEKPI